MKIVSISRWRNSARLYWEIETDTQIGRGATAAVSFTYVDDSGKTITKSNGLNNPRIKGRTIYGHVNISGAQSVAEGWNIDLASIQSVSVSYNGERATKTVSDTGYASNEAGEKPEQTTPPQIREVVFNWINHVYDDYSKEYTNRAESVRYIVTDALINPGANGAEALAIEHGNAYKYRKAYNPETLTEEALAEKLNNPGDSFKESFTVFRREIDASFFVFISSGTTAKILPIEDTTEITSVSTADGFDYLNRLTFEDYTERLNDYIAGERGDTPHGFALEQRDIISLGELTGRRPIVSGQRFKINKHNQRTELGETIMRRVL